jgi:hypothetical protein
MKVSHVVAHVFAHIDYSSGKTYYELCVPYPHRPLSILPLKYEQGLAFGEPGSGIVWANDSYENMLCLVSEIRAGVDKFGIKSFSFSFDFPDLATVEFWKQPGAERHTAKDNILYRERPLNEQEREAFLRALACLA